MTESSDVVALAVLAGLLSLLPVIILFWVYYLKEGEPSVPGRVVMRFFAAGMIAVPVALVLERGVYELTRVAAPTLAQAFFTDKFVLRHGKEILIAVVIAFGFVALIEEAVRYLILRFLVFRASELDQVVDGVQVGVAAGLGFAFFENTLYFLRLFQGLEFGTLAVVFFLRFFISTFGHLAFGGIMGYQLTRALVDPVNRRGHLARAFWLPWLCHGLFDVFLSVRLSAYTVIFLLLPLAGLWFVYRSPQFQQRFRLAGRMLRAPISARPVAPRAWRRPPLEVLPLMLWCPTCLAPLPRAPHGGSAEPRAHCLSCGTLFLRRGVSTLLRWVVPRIPAP